MYQESLKIGKNILLVNLPSNSCVECTVVKEKIKRKIEELVGINGYANGFLTVRCLDGMKIRGAINGECVEVK